VTGSWWDRTAYLQRIGYEGPVTPSAGTLAALSHTHLLHVPFENLEIVPLGRPLSLAPADLFAKIVVGQRGGFCYELNGLFALLLADLGFGVERLAFQFAEEGGYGPAFDHLALRVTTTTDDDLGPAGSPWLVDVGGGRNSFAHPIPLAPLGTASAPQPADGAVYRVTDGGAHQHVWMKEPGGDWVELYRFEPVARCLDDFVAMCLHHQSAPDSTFTQIPICTLLTNNGRIAVRGGVLTRSGPGWKEETPLPDEAAVHAAIREHFGIDLEQPSPPQPPSPNPGRGGSRPRSEGSGAEAGNGRRDRNRLPLS
jgi:N-hydroxyarylamine O-acetyltransferase